MPPIDTPLHWYLSIRQKVFHIDHVTRGDPGVTHSFQIPLFCQRPLFLLKEFCLRAATISCQDVLQSYKYHQIIISWIIGNLKFRSWDLFVKVMCVATNISFTKCRVVGIMWSVKKKIRLTMSSSVAVRSDQRWMLGISCLSSPGRYNLTIQSMIEFPSKMIQFNFWFKRKLSEFNSKNYSIRKKRQDSIFNSKLFWANSIQ